MKSSRLTNIIAAATLSLSAGACSPSSKVVTVSPQAFEKGIIETPGAQVIDVRDSTEYGEDHIIGAQNIDINSPEFISKADKSLSKSKPVYVYCRGGRRSKEAADILVKKGYNVVNLDGGLLKWKEEGLPVVTE